MTILRTAGEVIRNLENIAAVREKYPEIYGPKISNAMREAVTLIRHQESEIAELREKQEGTK